MSHDLFSKLSISLPARVQELLRSLLNDGASVEAVVQSDMLNDGRFGDAWAVLTLQRLLVLETAGTGEDARIATDVSLTAIKEPRCISVVGGGIVQARIENVLQTLLRYSNAREKRVAAFIRILSGHIEAQQERETTAVVSSDSPLANIKDEEKEDERRCPNCGLLLSEGTRVCPACLRKHRVIRRLFGYMRPYWWQVSVFIFLLLGGTLASLVPPYLNRPLIDDVLTPSVLGEGIRYTLLGFLVLALLLSRAAVQALDILRGRLGAWLGTRLGHQLRTAVFENLQFQSMGFYDKNKTGALIARVGQDTSALERALIDGIPFFISNILTLIFIATILFLFNWQLTLLIFLPVPIVIVMSRLAWNKLRRVLHRFWHVRARMHSVLSDSLSGVRVIKAFAQETQEVQRFSDQSNRMSLTEQTVAQYWATFFPILGFLTGLGSLVVWYFGGRQVIGNDDMTLGTLLAFVAYLGMFYGPMRFLSRIGDWLVRALASAERIFEVLDTPPDVPESHDAVALPRIRGSVEFRDVVFGYDQHKPVLNGISLNVDEGEMIGLVGKSGAGKTTTINLLCRFYDVNAGAIIIDGVDIRSIRQHDLRSQIGVVLQETFLFNDSILENIRYAKSDAAPEEVMAAAKAANAHDFIVQKPDGYDTIVGERGGALSGGERQRISIARAILHNPRILILDEATSNVDTDTEKQIQDAISRLVKGRTVFAIAHRLSTLRNADRLVVLKDGRIEEMGTHDELLEKEGEFHRLVEMQKAMSAIKAVGGESGAGVMAGAAFRGGGHRWGHR